jgi:flagellar biosynthesis GTPase FlhF
VQPIPLQKAGQGHDIKGSPFANEPGHIDTPVTASAEQTIETPAIPKHQVKHSVRPMSTQAQDFGSFETTPGIPEPERPKRSELITEGAVAEGTTYGQVYNLIEKGMTDNTPMPNYDVMKYIPDRYLTEEDIPHYIDNVNPEQTDLTTLKLDREKHNQAIIAEYPWTYFGEAALAGMGDPINWMIPGSKIVQAATVAYKGALAGKAGITAAALAKTAGHAALLGAGSAAIQEAAMLGLMETRELQDSFYGVMAGAAISGVLGAAVPGIVSGATLRHAKQQTTNVIAGGNPTPTMAPRSYVFNMDPLTAFEMNNDNVVATLPGWVRKLMNIAPAGGLRNSESPIANMAATDITTSALNVNKNITKNKANDIPVDIFITQARNKTRKIMVDVNEIFMEQQGVVGGLFKGVRSRIAEGSKGLGREDFSIAVQEAMESGKKSSYDPINKAVDAVRKHLQETKQELVELGLLNKKFLDPKFDNYFTRHWNRNNIIRNHSELKLLLTRWYQECNDYFKANKQRLAPLNKARNDTEKGYEKARGKMYAMQQSEEYKVFQNEKLKTRNDLKIKRQAAKQERQRIREEEKATKKEISLLKKEIEKLEKQGQPTNEQIKKRKKLEKELAQKTKEKAQVDAHIKELKIIGETNKLARFKGHAELELELEDLKNAMGESQEALFNAIDPKYLTADGHVPSGNKTPIDLMAAVDQSFLRMTGGDVERFMNPVIGGPGGGKPDPLQQRVLTIPWDYSTTTFDGRTIRAADFYNRNIWDMLDNYGRQTAATVAFTKVAKARGFADETELKRFYVQGITDDYQFKMQGTEGKKATQLEKAKKKDLARLNAMFEQQYGLSGKGESILGPGFARFVSRLRQYNGQRMLGSAFLSSIADIMVAPFRQGIFNWTQDILLPTLRGIGTKNSAFKMNKNSLKDGLFALNTEIGQIAKAFIDNNDLLIEQGWWRKIAEPAVTMFYNATGINQLSDAVESMAGHISISRTLRNIAKKVEKGKISERDRIRLRNITISEESERHIYDMFKESGGVENGAYWSGHDKWNVNTAERNKAFQEFTSSIATDIAHSTLRSSKSEVPAWADHLLGRILLHFKDFLFAATQKLLLSGLQKLGQREYDVILSLMAVTSMGSLSYVLTSLAKDPTADIDLSPEKLLREGLDRGAVFGILMEPINIFQKQGWLPGQPVSRMTNRGMVGNFLGPEIGIIDDVANTLISPAIKKFKGEEKYDTKDAAAILRLIPYQNLWYIRYLNMQITKGVATELGAAEKD